MLSIFVDDNDRDGANDVVVDMLLDYLLKNERTKLMEKLRERKMVPKVMDEYDCAALLDESGIKIWQWRKIQQCLKVFMDIKQVVVSENRMLTSMKMIVDRANPLNHCSSVPPKNSNYFFMISGVGWSVNANVTNHPNTLPSCLLPLIRQ
jgi:hypothetical protein